MRAQIAILGVVCGFYFPMIAHSEENKADMEVANRAASLIEKLVRPETKAKLSHEEELLRERELIKTWIELRDLGTEAFPTVIRHLQDKRKSFTTDSGSTNETWTVGRACFDAIRCNVEPFSNMYSSSIPPEEYWWRPQYCRKHLSTPEKAQEWFETRRDKSLIDLQIEALEWVASNHSGRKVEVNKEDRQSLLDLLEKLKREREPMKPSVPWAK